MTDSEHDQRAAALREALAAMGRASSARDREMADLEARILRAESRPARTGYAPALGAGLLGALGGFRRFRADRRLLLGSPLFDVEWYRERYAEFPAAEADPARDYLLEGAALDRDPGPDFSTAWYLDRHRDVLLAGVNPLVHYLRTGVAEGKLIHGVRS